VAPRRLKIVFDEHFSHHQVEFVCRESRLGEIQHTRRMKWSGRPDTEWMPMAIKAGFVIVSGDRNERTRGYTIADLKQMGAIVILLGGWWDHTDRWARAKWLVSRFEHLARLAQELPAGSAVLVNRFGKAKPL
jgi:hypothetical protein